MPLSVVGAVVGCSARRWVVGAVVGAVEGPLSVGWRQAKVGPPLGLAKVMSG